MNDRPWRWTASTLFRRTTTGVVLLPPESEEPLLLAGAAALLWDVLEEPTTESDAIALLADACAQDAEQIGSAVLAVLSDLRELGVAEQIEAPAC